MREKRANKTTTEQLDMEASIAILRKTRERILIRLVTAISRACTVFGARSLKHLGISMSQAIVLGELFSHNGCRQEDLRVFVALDKGNVTRALQGLEEFGLVQRKQDSKDRRVIRVYVTKKALSIENEMYALATHWDDRLTVGLTPQERETLVTLLLRTEVNARKIASKDSA